MQIPFNQKFSVCGLRVDYVEEDVGFGVSIQVVVNGVNPFAWLRLLGEDLLEAVWVVVRQAVVVGIEDAPVLPMLIRLFVRLRGERTVLLWLRLRVKFLHWQFWRGQVCSVIAKKNTIFQLATEFL